MPNWLVHSLAGWITGKTTRQDIGLLVIGSLLPDLNKFYLVFDGILKTKTTALFLQFHTPVGAVLIACVIALLFQNMKKALVPLIVGIATHFILDLLLVDISGGLPLLFPFSWSEWQLNLIQSNDYDYMITIYAIAAAVVVFLIYGMYEKRKIKRNKPL